MAAPKNLRKKDGSFSHPLFVKDKLNVKERNRAVAYLKELVNEYEAGEGIVVRASTFLFADLIKAFSRDIEKLIELDGIKNPSEEKIAGYFTFWIRKLKPLQDIEETTRHRNTRDLELLRLFLNEQFAVNVGLSLLSGLEKAGGYGALLTIIKSDNYSELLSHLRYRAISPQAMAVIFRMLVDIGENQQEVITKLATALEYRDDDTGKHVNRIANISDILAEQLKYPDIFKHSLHLATIMHDMGKIAIPDEILKKKTPLTKEEYDEIKTHAAKGASLLSGSKSSILNLAKSIARSHHERWNGEGYPDGLSGEKIPLEARIVAVADAFDAMMSDRIYRKSLGKRKSLQEIRKNSGTQFDPTICSAFLKCSSTIIDLYE